MQREYENRSKPAESSRYGNPPHQFDPVSGAWATEVMRQTQSCTTAGRVARHAIGLMSGVALGAGAMYLLDPEKGPDRRHHLADAANDAIDRTSDTVRDTLHVLGKGASRAGSSIGERGSELMESLSSSLPSRRRIRKHGQRLMDRVRDRFEDMTHHGRSSADSLRDSANDWLDSARSHLPKRRSYMSGNGVSATTVTLSGVAALALGAGAMWLFDPRLGRARRAWIGQKATHALHETGDFMRATGRHLRNKSKGYSHRATHAARNAASHLPGYSSHSSGELSSAQNTLRREGAEAISYGADVTTTKSSPCD
jgi:gas vesicle protein